MSKGRLEAFSDGVIAILITIMVLELRPPESPTLTALGELKPVILSYLLSFVFLGSYWNSHHHFFQACRQVNGGVLWANLHLLFWLSLTPFVTAWMGETHFAPMTVAAFGLLQLLCSLAFYGLSRALVAIHDADSPIRRAVGVDSKGKISIAIYVVSIPLAFVSRAVALVLFSLVAIMWIVPDRRIEQALAGHRG